MTALRFVPAGRARTRGFTLLEVMIALALLGFGLTVLIKSAAGNIFNAQQAHMIGVGTLASAVGLNWLFQLPPLAKSATALFSAAVLIYFAVLGESANNKRDCRARSESLCGFTGSPCSPHHCRQPIVPARRV